MVAVRSGERPGGRRLCLVIVRLRFTESVEVTPSLELLDCDHADAVLCAVDDAVDAQIAAVVPLHLFAASGHELAHLLDTC